MANAKVLPLRSEIDKKYLWRGEEVFADTQAWEKAFRELKLLAEKASQYAGTLTKGPQELLAFLQYDEELSQKLDLVYLYAAMKKDEDNENTLYQELKDKVQGLAVEIGAALAFVAPEILSIPEHDLSNWLLGEKLSPYNRYIGQVTRLRKHILNIGEEEIMALAGDVCAAPRNVFSMLNNADIKFPIIKDDEGTEIELSHGNYSLFMENKNRQIRKNAFSALYATYEKQKFTLAALLAANVKKNVFVAKVRHYESSLAHALYNEEIPVRVYDNLIKAVRNNLPHFQRYLALRKEILGVDELHLYDMQAPLAENTKEDIPYEKAVEMVLAALAPLGQDYVRDAKAGLENGWVDVMENKGKTSGAYSSGVYSTKPYILMNYQNNLQSVFTLAHELGHSMHSYYSNQNQPYIYSQYEIFVAEVASTVNETLLLRYLLSIEKEPVKRLMLLNHYLDEFRGTVYRQTMFAEFEKAIHYHAQDGQSLSCQWLCDTYYKLNLDYFGEGVQVDKEIEMEWSRIPHFYRSFYVYKYATGFSAANALAARVLSGGYEEVNDYRAFLAGGSSTDPISLLRRAGVDMENPETLDNAFKIYAEMLEELAKVAKEIK